VASSKSLSNLAEELRQAVSLFKLSNRDTFVAPPAEKKYVITNSQPKGNGKKTAAEVKRTVKV
jgi:hypothetical protein